MSKTQIMAKICIRLHYKMILHDGIVIIKQFDEVTFEKVRA